MQVGILFASGSTHTQKLIPLLLPHAADVAEEERIGWLERPAQDKHAGFVGSVIAFFSVAPFARCDQVQPRVRAAPRTGYHMIQRKFPPGTAILTFKIIPLKDVLPGEVDTPVRRIHVPVEPDHRRHGETACYAVNPVTIGRTHHFTLVQVDEHKRPLH